MRTTLLASILILFTGAVTPAAEQTITPAAMTSWQIVCSPTATECEKYAAAEFQLLFKEMTGTELPIVAKASEDTRSVFIGPDAVAAPGGRCSWTPWVKKGWTLV